MTTSVRDDGPGNRSEPGPGPCPGPGNGAPRSPGRGRARRGRLRATLIVLLAERPMYGNEMIGEIERRTDGLWRPSPGSVYPTLKGLVEAGLVVEREIDGRRHATLTESGRAVAGQLPARPWRDLCPRRWPSASDDLQETLEHLLAAVDQAREIADADQRIHLIGVLEGARRAIYRVLAGAPSSSSGDTPERSD